MLSPPYFIDRYDAGHRLGVALRQLPLEPPLIVLGLPRGGVPVAVRVADELDAPLDVFLVRKLGAPQNAELAFGAIASGGVRVLNKSIISTLRISPQAVEYVVAAEERELARREAAYRDGRAFPSLVGQTVVVVDDGAATGASMRAAIVALRRLRPSSIIAAIPVASRDAIWSLETIGDGCVCIIAPNHFDGVGQWYRDFTQVSDREVRQLLAEAHRRRETPAPVLGDVVA
jgi:predicted phosphoribosyltransferase